MLLFMLWKTQYMPEAKQAIPRESQNVAVCVILSLNCPWDEEHGWAAVFIEEKFVKVDRDIVDCVWLD